MWLDYPARLGRLSPDHSFRSRPSIFVIPEALSEHVLTGQLCALQIWLFVDERAIVPASE